MRKVTIIGAGLVGSLLSLYLIKLGHEVELYEKRPDGRKLNIYEGRSINLALSHRGIKALKEVGIFREIEDILIPMLGRQMHDLEGIITYLPYGKDDSEFINSVSRSDLNFKLMTAAEVSGRATIHFDHECIDYLGSENKLTISSPEGEKTIYPELLFGTDGANSAIRDTMKREGAVFSIDKLSHGYKELVIPALENNKFAIEKMCYTYGREVLI